MRLMPYADASFDVVYSLMNMWGLPYLPGTGLGMEAVFTEIGRILRPDGMFIFSALLGGGREYLLLRPYC
jgi:SAM-dependent methyltransferase